MNSIKTLHLAILILLISGCGNSGQSSSNSGDPIVQIVVTPNLGTIPNPGSNTFQQFSAVAYDSNNQPVAGIKFTWTDIGTNSCIDQNGRAAFISPPAGPETIEASYGSLSQPASLFYKPGAVFQSSC
ncbi:MAG: hypothetical protein ACHQYP_03355 [Nitrospiria bacterium]